MTPADYAGIVTCISATTGGVVSIIIAFRQRDVKRTLEGVHEEVQTPGGQTLGETMAHVHEVVCDERT